MEAPGKLKEQDPRIIKSQNGYEEPNSSNQSRFDKVKIQGKLKESPRGTEREFRITMSVCFLRTQQRAKSQCIIRCTNPPRDQLFGVWFHGFSHESLMVGFLFSGLSLEVGLVSVIQRRV